MSEVFNAENNDAPILTSEILMSLHREGVTSASDAATVRGEYATRVKSLQQTHGLNGRAFRMASQIRKMENGKREHFIGDLLRYMELMDCNQQKSLSDTILDNNAGKVRTDLDKAMDGEPVTAPADAKGNVVGLAERRAAQQEIRLNQPTEPTTAIGRRHLGEFRDAIASAVDRTAVNVGLERFCTDFPGLVEHAGEIARERLVALGQEQGGGEDLRSKAQRDSEAAEADQAADAGKAAAKEKAPRKSRAKAKPDGETEAPPKSALH